MTPFEKFHAVVEAALAKHLDDLFAQDSAHESYCLCLECVCVRGVREELKSYAKGTERRGKKPVRGFVLGGKKIGKAK